MIIELMNFVVIWINAFPTSSGVSITYSPHTITTGTALDYSKYCKPPFGAYIETQEENNLMNMLTKLTRGAICVGPTANFQESYKFLCIHTGRRITIKKIR
jgi:hypothetical protein